MAADANLTDWLTFIRDVMMVPASVLPDTANIIPLTLDAAELIVNEVLGVVGAPQLLGAAPSATPYASFFPQPPSYIAWAIYNFAGDRLVNYAADDATLTPPLNTYWKDLRASYGLNSFTPGFVQSTSDQGSSVGFLIPDWAKTMTPGDLQMMKTPWGRDYITLAMAYGPTIWDLTA
jgi:hypothetical protein